MKRAPRALGAALACSIPTLAPAPDAHAANKTWIGGSGNWSVGSNWTPVGAPSSADNVFLTSSDLVPRTVTYNLPGPFLLSYGNVTVQTLQSTMELRQPGTNLVASSLSLSSFNNFGGALHTVTDGAAAFIGSLTIGAAGSASVSNASFYDVGSAAQFNGGVTVDSTSTFTVGGTYAHSGGTFAGPMTVRPTGSLVLNGGTFAARVDNSGQLVVNGDAYVEALTNRAAFTLPVGRALEVGDFIDQRGASFTQSDGARTRAASYTVQQNATWTQHGGLSEGNTTVVGGDLGPGTFVMNGGTHTLQGLLHVGLDSAGSFIQSGGTARAILMTVGGAPTIGFSRGHYRLNGGSLVTSGQIIIGSENSLGGTFEQTGGSSDFFRFHVNVNSTTSGAIKLSGGLLRTNAPSINNGSIDVTGGSMRVGGSLDGAGSVTVTGTGSMSVDRIRQNSLFVGGGGRVYNVSPTGRTVVNRVGSLTFGETGGGGAVTGTWDLEIARLAIDYAGAANSPAANVRRYLRSAYGGGSWNGTGLTSSFAGAHGTALGYIESADLFGPGGGTFDDLGVDDTTLLVRLTFYGDANLDTRVNLADFNRLAANFGTSGRFWWHGDFNYDGNVNLTDFNLLAANFGMSGAPELSPADWAALAGAVPEPSAALLFTSALAAVPRRARRRKRCA